METPRKTIVLYVLSQCKPTKNLSLLYREFRLSCHQDDVQGSEKFLTYGILSMFHQSNNHDKYIPFVYHKHHDDS